MEIVLLLALLWALVAAVVGLIVRGILQRRITRPLIWRSQLRANREEHRPDKPD